MFHMCNSCQKYNQEQGQSNGIAGAAVGEQEHGHNSSGSGKSYGAGGVVEQKQEGVGADQELEQLGMLYAFGASPSQPLPSDT